MCCCKWMEEKIKKLSVCDYGVLKLTVVAFTLMLAKLWPSLLSLAWYWYGLVFAVLYGYLVYKLFLKK